MSDDRDKREDAEEIGGAPPRGLPHTFARGDSLPSSARVERAFGAPGRGSVNP